MKIETTRMSSLSLSILLQKPAWWENFTNDANNWIEKLGAKLIDKINSVDERI